MENKMKYQYSLTAIEPHKDEGLTEIHICNTESLEAVCKELLRYKSKKERKHILKKDQDMIFLVMLDLQEKL